MRRKIIISAILTWGVFFYSSALFALPTDNFYKCAYTSNAAPVYQYKIIQAPGNTWGYDILRDNKVFIHQPNIPGVPGTEGFRTKKDAMKVAQLVLDKIKNGEMPPTVTIEALRILKLVD